MSLPNTTPPTMARPPICGERGTSRGGEDGVAAPVAFLQRAAVCAEGEGLDEGREDDAGQEGEGHDDDDDDGRWFSGGGSLGYVPLAATCFPCL
ncbi:hypothetical protein PG994_009267 [Apiospora phragmitis]|uniref:Uncharacterized protein n=1 Tax=Apiospora phragmitis TaxID=2905665 RepID=A0ABR1ULT0_9PEZI